MIQQEKTAGSGDNTGSQERSDPQNQNNFVGENSLAYTTLIQPAVNWCSTTLGEIAFWGAGGTPSRSNPNFYTGNVPWFKTGDLGPKIVFESEELITEEAISKSSAKLFPKGSVAIAMYGATIGKTSILGISATTNQACAVGNPINGITTSEFLYYLLRNEKENFVNIGKGGAQPNISQTVIKEYQIKLPPLAEQHQIATKLDELLAQVDSIKTRLDAIPKILKRFRQSVLAAAVSGKLTEDWRINSCTASHKECEEWKWSPVPVGWSVKRYSEVVDSRLGKMLDKAKNTGRATKYLGNINVRWFGFDLENTQEILVSDSERNDLSLKFGDVLICEGGEPGRSAVWNVDISEPIVFQKALHRVRVKGEIRPQWLVFNLKNDADSLVLNQLFTGTTIKHLTGKAIKQYPIRIPPIEEQTEIVRRVEQFFAYADQIEQRVKDAQTRVNHLTQAILAKAFRGELTADWRAQNPDLISGENSAEALLARIQAERQKEKPKSGRKIRA